MRSASGRNDDNPTPRLLIDEKVQSFDLLEKAGGHGHDNCLLVCDSCLLPSATAITEIRKKFWIFDTTTPRSAKLCPANCGGWEVLTAGQLRGLPGNCEGPT
ncbi:hypothetical protein ACHAPM_003635 [Fusarium culmorum]